MAAPYDSVCLQPHQGEFVLGSTGRAPHCPIVASVLLVAPRRSLSPIQERHCDVPPVGGLESEDDLTRKPHSEPLHVAPARDVGKAKAPRSCTTRPSLARARDSLSASSSGLSLAF